MNRPSSYFSRLRRIKKVRSTSKHGARTPLARVPDDGNLEGHGAAARQIKLHPDQPAP